MERQGRPKCSSLPALRSPLAKALLACALGMALAAANAAGQTPTLLFSSSAYGTYAYVGNTIVLGQTAPVNTPGCGAQQIGYQRTGTVASVGHEPEAATGAVDTSVITFSNGTTATSDVHDINLLSGVITANELKAVSTVRRGAGGLQSSGGGSNFSDLVVAGSFIQSTAAPNTTLALAGLGRVVLNEQIGSASASQMFLTVNMIHVYVTVANNQNIPVGTEIIIGSAQSGLIVAPGPSIVAGGAFGTFVQGQSLQSSYTAPENVSCMGTNGVVRTNTASNVSVAPALNTGAVTDSAEGNITPSLASVNTQSTAHAVNILNGLVTADSVNAAAHGSTADGVNLEFSDDGSSMTNLRIAGASQIGEVAPNTEINLPGVGTLWLHRVITSGNYLEVHMIELEVQKPNIYNLPIGTDIQVGWALVQLFSNSRPSTM